MDARVVDKVRVESGFWMVWSTPGQSRPDGLRVSGPFSPDGVGCICCRLVASFAQLESFVLLLLEKREVSRSVLRRLLHFNIIVVRLEDVRKLSLITSTSRIPHADAIHRSSICLQIISLRYLSTQPRGAPPWHASYW